MSAAHLTILPRPLVYLERSKVTVMETKILNVINVCLATAAETVCYFNYKLFYNSCSTAQFRRQVTLLCQSLHIVVTDVLFCCCSASFLTKSVTLDMVIYKYQIWDTAGQEKVQFRTLCCYELRD